MPHNLKTFLHYAELMAELGLSDISDVSDPNFSEEDRPIARLKQTANKEAADKQAQSDEESDWDSTGVSPVINEIKIYKR